MIKIFRKIRQDLLSKGKSIQYFKYAIGEIILVVIGILIALQVSNWNENRIKKNKIDFYYVKLLEELNSEIIVVENFLKVQKDLAEKQSLVLEILSEKNYARIPELEENLGAIATSWSINYSFQIFDEFIKQDLLSEVKDVELKKMFKNLKNIITDNIANNEYIDKQYNTLIEPYFAEHINYPKVAMLQYKKGLKQGGPENNYDEIFNSMKLWNVCSLKLETTNGAVSKLKTRLTFLNSLQLKLEKINKIK